MMLFFFSSRRRHTRYWRDWSSDVCSSDLHRLGYQTWYAHLASFSARTGQRVAGGTRIASAGSTGRSTGPHLHWEVRLNGTPINPIPYLLGQTSLKPLVRDPEDPACVHRRSGDDPN